MLRRQPHDVGQRSDGAGVAAAGVMTIAAAYGFARYGYGLFESAFRAQFHLSVAGSGAVAATSYVGYVAGLLAVGALVDRLGPRVLIAAAAVAAVLGLGLMAVAANVTALVTGVVVAGASSGLGWAPYSDVVDRSVRTPRRSGVLAAIASGTAFGIVVAGASALLAGAHHWRPVWWAFCVLGLVALAANVILVPTTIRPVPGLTSAPGAIRSAVRSSAVRRLFLTALAYGVVGSVYWTFSVSAISASDTGSATGPVFWTLIGLSGTIAIAAGRLFARLGLRRAHHLLFAALGGASLTTALAPWSWWAIGPAAVTYGAAFMATSGLLAVWSYQLFPQRPSTGFTVTVFMLGIGSILGPVALGIVADQAGLPVALAVTAGVAIAALALGPSPTGPHRSTASGIGADPQEEGRPMTALLDRNALVDGMRVAYRDRGEGDAVVFVHGTPSHSYEWRDIVPRVEAAGHRVVTYDLLGYGASERPLDHDTSVSAQTELLVGLLDQLDVDRPTLVAHDIGGAIGQRLAVLHPTRLRRLLLIDPVSYDSWPSPTWQKIIDDHLAEHRAMPAPAFDDLMTRQLAMTVADPATMTGSTLEGFLAPHRGALGQVSFFEHQVRHYDPIHTLEITDRLGELTVPVRLLWGADDQWQPVTYGRRLAADIPGAELVVVPGAGHFLPEDAPDRVTREVLDFIEARADEDETIAPDRP